MNAKLPLTNVMKKKKDPSAIFDDFLLIMNPVSLLIWYPCSFIQTCIVFNHTHFPQVLWSRRSKLLFSCLMSCLLLNQSCFKLFYIELCPLFNHYNATITWLKSLVFFQCLEYRNTFILNINGAFFIAKYLFSL